MLNAIIRGSLRNRLLVLVLAAGVLAWGAYTAQRAPVDIFPQFAPPQVVLQTEAPGFPPSQVEQQVTYPLEAALLGMSGVQDVRSTSIAGLSVITLIFNSKTNLWVDRELVSQAVASVAGLPAAAGPPRMAPASSAIGIIDVFGLTQDGPVTPATEYALHDYAQWVIQPRLLAVPGVAQVTLYGGLQKQYEAVVAPARLRQYHLTLEQVIAAAGSATSQGAGGYFETPSQDLVIHASGQIDSLAQLGASVVAVRQGVPVTLGQIADIAYGAPPRIGGATINGRQGVVMQVIEQPDASTVPTTNGVEAALASLRKNLPPGMELRTDLQRQSDFILASIGGLREAMWEGAILVILVLLLFIRSWRAAAISVLAIPLSLLLAIAILVGFGATINTMTLGGLVLALGEVVDDAIIDVENVSRRLRERAASSAGKSSLIELVYRSSAEVRDSVVHATLAVALVFLPIFFLTGLEGHIFTPLGEAYILATLSSLLVALTVTPVLAFWLLPGDRQVLDARETGVALWLKRRYRRVVEATLAHPKLIGGASVAAAAVALGALPFMGGAFLPDFAQNQLVVHMAAAAGSSLQSSLQAGIDFEHQLMRLPDVASVEQRAGRAELGEDTTPVNYSEFDVRFKPRGKPLAQLEAEVQSISDRFPEFVWSVDEPISERINEVLSGTTSALAVKIFGPDENVLRQLAQQVHGIIAGVPGAAGLQYAQQTVAPQVDIRFDRQAAQAYGVTSADVTSEAQAALVGATVGEVYQGRRTYPVVVKLPSGIRGSLSQIQALPIGAPAGAGSSPIPLAAVAQVQVTPGLAVINHEDGGRVQVVQTDVGSGDAVGFVNAVRQRIGRDVRLPPGYYIAYGGQFQSRADTVRRLEWLGLFVLAGILFLLYYAFRAWRDAWIVIVNVPLAFIGGILAVLVSGSPISIATLVGFITLFGITLRNGIMLVTHYRHLQQHEGEGFGPEMVLRGATERLVPILMTALAYGLALIPLIVVTGQAGGALERPMAVVILGGLFTSTLLNLLVVPTLYLQYSKPVMATEPTEFMPRLP